MKNITLILALLCVFMMNAQGKLVFHDAKQFPLLGKAAGETTNYYTRLLESH